MIDFDDSDRLLDILGVVLAVFLLAGVAVLVLAAVNAPSQPATPDAGTEWTVERLNETHVVIEQRSGSPVPTAELFVTVSGRGRPFATARSASGHPALTVRATEGRLVQLYVKDGEDELRLLDSWQV